MKKIKSIATFQLQMKLSTESINELLVDYDVNMEHAEHRGFLAKQFFEEISLLLPFL